MYIGRGASFISRLMDNMYICAPPLSRCIHYRNMYVHMQGTISTPSAPSLGHMPTYVPPSPVTSLPHVYIHKTRGPSPTTLSTLVPILSHTYTPTRTLPPAQTHAQYVDQARTSDPSILRCRELRMTSVAGVERSAWRRSTLILA